MDWAAPSDPSPQGPPSVQPQTALTIEWALLRALILLLAACGAASGQPFFPIDDVRPGQRAVGRTVFQGDAIEDFEVEILGVLENFSGPKTSVIFGRLSGGPLERTGVMAGMSGSPVYIEGRLAGAVAFTYPFSKEPLAGIRPIGEMVSGFEEAAPSDLQSSPAIAVVLEDWGEQAGLSPRVRRSTAASAPAGDRLHPIATPVSMGGFSDDTLQVFQDRFRALGLRPLQGAGGRLREQAIRDPADPLEPGAMISVGLIRGDLTMNASGTVTHVDGSRIFAFGHRFLSAGATSLPMMRATVMALVPNLSSSFKLSASGPQIGAVTLDREAGIAGELGAEPALVPVRLGVRASDGRDSAYSMEIVRDAQLTPLLLQVALFSAISAGEPSFAPLTVRVRGGVRFANGLPDLALDDIYAGAGVGQAVSLSTAAPLAYLMRTGHSDVVIESIDLEVEAAGDDQYSDLVRAWCAKAQVRPGDAAEIRFASKGPDGSERLHSVHYRVPVSLPAGPVEVTISDALTANLDRWRGLLAGRRARDAASTIRFLNSLRGSDRAYVRFWHRKRSIWVHADRLPSPPASLHAILSTPAGRGGGALPGQSTTLEDRIVDGFPGVVRGRVDLRFVVTGS